MKLLLSQGLGPGLGLGLGLCSGGVTSRATGAMWSRVQCHNRVCVRVSVCMSAGVHVGDNIDVK